jgi:hypothetical protein
MVIYVGHIISILLFLSVIATAVGMAVSLKDVTVPTQYLWIPRAVVIVLILQATLFLLLQSDYLLGNHHINAAVADPVGFMRGLYDILNGMALVTFATALNIFFRWRRNTFSRTDDDALEALNNRKEQ